MAALSDLVDPDIASAVDAPFLGGTLALHSALEDAFTNRDLQVLERFALVLSEGYQRLQDADRHRQAEELLEQQRLRAMQSERLRSLGEMAAGVVHELVQPLNSISTTTEDLYLRLLEGREVDRGDLQEMIQDEIAVIGRMMEIIEDLRRFSRDSAGEPHVPVSVTEAVRASLQMVGKHLSGTGLEVEVELAEDLPRVLGQQRQLQQVVLNLLTNARDAVAERQQAARAGALPPDSGWRPRITIRTAMEQESAEVLLEVQDTGSGIPIDVLPRIFEPFFTTKDAERGTGLGLSITRSIVQDHGGDISGANLAEGGAVFRVRLPALTPGDGAVSLLSSDEVI
jgi:C4-dicarboxylate-specific signal transduction histidine kinase